VDTYGQFVDENKKVLRTLPAPRVAKVWNFPKHHTSPP
jgi:hypothetical protein